jgi:3-keto-5-aminohexanoate cleavage enzyme
MATDVILTAALTGPVATKADNPNLPVTPEEIATAGEAAWRAGAAVLHVHLRDAAGNRTADLEVGRRVLDLLGERCGALIQLSTGVGFGVPLEERARLVELRPRMATLNVASMTFGASEFLNPQDGVRRLAERMGELGVTPELEVYDSGHLELALALRQEGLLTDPLRFSVVTGVRGGMASTADNVLAFVRRLPADAIWQAIGIGRHNLPMTTLGLALGGNARTGMEDTLTLRRGVPVSSNAELVERLANVAWAVEREPMSAAAAAAALQLPGAPDLHLQSTTNGGGR